MLKSTWSEPVHQINIDYDKFKGLRSACLPKTKSNIKKTNLKTKYCIFFSLRALIEFLFVWKLMCSYQSHRPESKKKVISLQEANSTESSGDGRRSQTDGCVCRKANQTITQLWSAHLMERREENGYVVALRANLLGCINRSNSANTTYSFSKDEQVFIHCYYRKIFLKRSEDIQWSVLKCMYYVYSMKMNVSPPAKDLQQDKQRVISEEWSAGRLMIFMIQALVEILISAVCIHVFVSVLKSEYKHWWIITNKCCFWWLIVLITHVLK